MPEVKRKFKLGELLMGSGRITRDQLDAALKRSRDGGMMLGETLVEMNLIKPLELLQIVGSQMVYISDDGQYMLQGTLYEAASRKDLTGARLAVDHKRKVDAVPASKRIVFAPPGKPKYKITVFTDLDCGYCRKLHSQIAQYNQEGIEVDYLFFPRSGLNSPSYDKAVSVWCAKDRKAAFTAAKAGQTPPVLKCDNPVADEFALGAQVGVDGTPAIYSADGRKVGGYLDPDQMVAKLKSLGTPTLAER